MIINAREWDMTAEMEENMQDGGRLRLAGCETL